MPPMCDAHKEIFVKDLTTDQILHRRFQYRQTQRQIGRHKECRPQRDIRKQPLKQQPPGKQPRTYQNGRNAFTGNAVVMVMSAAAMLMVVMIVSTAAMLVVIMVMSATAMLVVIMVMSATTMFMMLMHRCILGSDLYLRLYLLRLLQDHGQQPIGIFCRNTKLTGGKSQDRILYAGDFPDFAFHLGGAVGAI